MATLTKYLEQIQRSAQVFQGLISQQEVWRSITKQHDHFKKTIQPIAEMHSNIINLERKFRSQLETLISPAFTTFIESSKKLPEKTRNALLVLGEHGWYLDLEMPLTGLWNLEQEFKRGNVERVELALVKYFKGRAAGISKTLITGYPRRAKIISAAFKAHERGEYELSIPALLAQADGICQELIGAQLFKKRDNRPITALYIDDFAMDTFSSALLHPLSQLLPISYSADQRGEDFDVLNRHQVLHGESVNYGTEVNFLKTISLINYITQVLKKDRQDTVAPKNMDEEIKKNG